VNNLRLLRLIGKEKARKGEGWERRRLGKEKAGKGEG
jgi:hypothetical protein